MDTTCELADRSCEWKRHRGSCNPVVAQATQRGVNDSKFSMQILLWGLIPPPNPLFFSRSSPLWYTMSSRVQLNQRGKELLLQQLTLSGEVASSELYGSSTAWGGRGRCSKAEEGGREGCTLCRGKELLFFLPLHLVTVSSILFSFTLWDMETFIISRTSLVHSSPFVLLFTLILQASRLFYTPHPPFFVMKYFLSSPSSHSSHEMNSSHLELLLSLMWHSMAVQSEGEQLSHEVLLRCTILLLLPLCLIITVTHLSGGSPTSIYIIF